MSITRGHLNGRRHRTFRRLSGGRGALVRFLVRIGEKAETAAAVLRQVRARPGYEFWADSMSYADASLGHVRGHRQVTDAYLASLATDRGGMLATLDEALVAVLPNSAVLVAPH